MKVATLRGPGRDGRLVLVSRDMTRAVPVPDVAPTLIDALERWDEVSEPLTERWAALEAGRLDGSVSFEPEEALAPLPRTYGWLDGSTFKNHGALMCRAFDEDPTDQLNATLPLMYQGGSDTFLGARQDIVLPREEDGIDFEAEVGIVLSDTPMGTSAADAARYIRFVVLINDVSLRNYAKREKDTGFGWIQAKPSSSFAPVAIAPEELGPAWADGRVNLPVRVEWNGALFGSPNGQEMSFSFFELVEHAAKTRSLAAGTIIGSGTVSNAAYETVGSACIAERRAIELIKDGRPKTQFMRFGDRVTIDVSDGTGRSLFGTIDQTIVRYAPS